MHITEIFYTVVESDPEHKFRLPCVGTYVDLSDEWDMQHLAEGCADDFHSNHDGWEMTWPLTFALYLTEDGLEQCRFSVEREYEPSFSAYKES